MISDKPLSGNEVAKSLSELERKLGWIAFFQQQGGSLETEQFNPKLHVPSKRQAKPDSDVARFMRHTCDDVQRALARELEREKHKRTSNSSTIDKKAEVELKKGEVVVMESDKDGCWVIMSQEGYKQLEDEIVNSPSYQQVAKADIDTRQIRKTYDDACKKLCRGTKALRKFLTSTAASMQDANSHAAKLRMKVKTHKAAGKVKARAIHDGSSSPMSPAAAYISDVMERHVRCSYPHVVKDSTTMVQIIEKI